jgi:cinnamoyl-CoA:phenyllactate CoA-transferase
LAQVWDEVLQDKQAWATNVFYPMHYPNGGCVPYAQPSFYRTGLPDYKQSPLLGEHSEEILRVLGYSDEEMKVLHKADV